MLQARIERATDEEELELVCDVARFLAAQAAVEHVYVHPRLLQMCVDLVTALLVLTRISKLVPARVVRWPW